MSSVRFGTAERETLMSDACHTPKVSSHAAAPDLQELFSTAPFGIFTTTPEGRFLTANPALAKMFGYQSPRELIASTTDIATQLYANPADRASFRQQLETQGEVSNHPCRLRRRDGTDFWGLLHVSVQGDAQQRIVAYQGLMIDCTKLAETGETPQRLQWMLSGDTLSRHEAGRTARDQGYGDLTALNRGGLILTAIGRERLKHFSHDYLELLGTSSAIYEANGDYAFGIFTSGWCRMMDGASRKLCDTADDATALSSGQWLCHESCWTDCSQRCIAERAPVDIACKGGIRMYAVPIVAGDEVVGAINFGYGDPPKDLETLRQLAEKYHLDVDKLAREAAAYDSRPPFIIELAKNRLHTTAQLIGTMIETKQTAEALRNQEETLRTTLRSIGDAVISTDVEGRVRMMNPVAEQLTGWSEQEATGQALDTVFPIINEHSRQAVSSPVVQVMKSGQIVGLANHTLLLAKDGREIPIADSGAPIRNDAGAITGVVLVFRDQSEERATREALEISEEMMRSSQAEAHICSYSTNLNVDAIDESAWICSPEFYRIFGIDETYPHTIAGWENFLHPDHREEIFAYHQQVVREGIPFNREYKILRIDDGVERWVHGTGTLVYDEAGKPIRMYGAIQDITEHKRAEEALRESEERYRTLHNASFGGITIHDKGLILECNQGLSEITGYSYDELIGMNGLLLISDATREKVIHHINTGYEEPYEVEGVRKNGEIYPVRLEAKIIKYKGKDVRVVEFRDITDQRQLQESLVQAQKMDAIGQLAGGVAHDFNNQLTGVLGFASMLLERLDDPTLKRYAEGIITSAQRSADLTQKLLAFSRKGQFQRIPVDVHRIINDTVEMLQHSIDKRIRIRRCLEAQQAQIIGDPSQLQNALLNLAVNARDAMSEGGELTFSTSIATLEARSLPGFELSPGSYLIVAVEDSGSGMSQEVQAHLFEPFFTTKEQGKGTGMGLASAFGTVTQHQGAITVSSEPGHGSTFRLYLPLAEHSNDASRGDTPPMGVRSQLRILLVEDEELVREFVQDMLGEVGHRVETATDGRRALERYRQIWQEIDLVILDMIMPGLDGRDTFRAMKAINPAVRAILASGYSLNQQSQAILAEGALGFVQKPFSPNQLLRAVECATGE